MSKACSPGVVGFFDRTGDFGNCCVDPVFGSNPARDLLGIGAIGRGLKNGLDPAYEAFAVFLINVFVVCFVNCVFFCGCFKWGAYGVAQKSDIYIFGNHNSVFSLSNRDTLQHLAN